MSIDWRQVLDTIRVSQRRTFRPEGYSLHELACRKLEPIARAENTIVVINTFCHSLPFRRGVLSVPRQNLVDYNIVTGERDGVGANYTA